jgi:nuclear protein localization family protein 4
VQEIHLEVFQMSKQAVQLYKEGWFVPPAEDSVLVHTRMQHPTDKSVKLPVMINTNDTNEVDNDFWLVPMRVLDHAGPWMLSFPVENRLIGQVSTDTILHH